MCETTDEDSVRSDRNAIFKMSYSIPGRCCSCIGQVVIAQVVIGQVVIGQVVQESGI